MTPSQPISLQHKKDVDFFLQKYPPSISEHTFTNLYVWRHSRPVWISKEEDTVLFLIHANENSENKILLGAPVGPSSLSNILKQQNNITGAIRLPERDAIGLKKSGQHIFEDRDNFDYVYLVKDLADLQGRHYAKKRNHVKQCLTRYTCEYETITDSNINECVAMLELWCGQKNCETTPGLCGEFRAIMESFDQYGRFDLIGGAIRVDGEIKAFALAEKLTPDTAVWHFEKAMPDVHGLAQLINKWFAQYSLQQFKYVNREQDLGISGLRQAKESYHPQHMVSKYNTMSKPPASNIAGCF